MSSTLNYGQKALITACRTCFQPGCTCKSETEEIRAKVNRRLGPSHQLEQADYDAICLDLDQHPISDRPTTSGDDEKKRDDGHFDQLVEEAFKAFRDQERYIILNAPPGIQLNFDDDAILADDSTRGKWWIGAAHLRHHLEFLLVLKGIRPCILLMKFAPKNVTIFSTLVIDCLVPIMDRLNLWSYGFRISFMSEEWVFYDSRSTLMPQITKIFLTHPSAKDLDPISYPHPFDFGVPDGEMAVALGYPVAFDNAYDGSPVHIRDTTEMGVLTSRGWSEGQCCVQGMIFYCPEEAVSEEDLLKILIFYYRCEQAARSVGTQLQIFTGFHQEMTHWLAHMPGFLEGPEGYLGSSGPALQLFMEAVETVEQRGQSVWTYGQDGAQHTDEDQDGSGGHI